MFEIVLRNPEATADNPFKITFINPGTSISSTIFISWICNDEIIGL